MTYTFRQIRDAINAAEPSTTFPFGAAVSAQTWATIRAAPHFQPLMESLRSEAERARSTELGHLHFSLFRQFETTGNRHDHDQHYFERRQRLMSFALVTLIDGTESYLDALQDTIWMICNEYTWVIPAHLPIGLAAVETHRIPPAQMVDLFAAETAQTLSEILLLLGDRLDPWIVYRIRSEIERRVFHPLFDTSVHFGWESAAHNWAAVCMGQVGMAALVLEPNRERLAGMIERVVRALECFLDGYGADGGSPEGIGYWQYGFGSYVYFAEALHEFTNGKLDLLEGDHIRSIAAFPAKVSMGAGTFVPYSDAPRRTPLQPGLITRLVERVGMPVPELDRVPAVVGDRNVRWLHATRNLLWTDPALLHRPTDDATVILPDLQWVLDRRTIGETRVVFSAKGGHNDEPHNHNDLGHFILHLGDETLLTDLGAGRYTRDYFHGDRYSYLHPSSEGHSVPIINGKPQRGGPEAVVQVIGVEQSADGITFALDLTAAYDLPTLHQFTRTFDWRVEPDQQSARLTLTDAFAAAEPLPIDELFISLHEPTIDGNAVTWRGQAGSVTLQVDPAVWRIALEQIAAEDHSLAHITVYRLRLSRAVQQASEHHQLVFSCRIGKGS